MGRFWKLVSIRNGAILGYQNQESRPHSFDGRWSRFIVEDAWEFGLRIVLVSGDVEHYLGFSKALPLGCKSDALVLHPQDSVHSISHSQG